MNVKVSVIVPVYNVENYLKRCVDSIRNQTLKDIEIILVDDGSTDSSGKICDEIQQKDERVKVIHKQNGGLSSARNEGLKFASAELIGFVDSDDWISEDMYEYLYTLQAKTGADITSCSYTLAFADSDVVKKQRIDEVTFNKNEAIMNYLRLGLFSDINDYSAWKKLYKKSLFSYLVFPEGYLFEDMATNFELIQHCKLYAYSTKVCYFYFQNSSSITRNQYSLKHNDLISVSEKIVALSKTEDEIVKKYANIQIEKAYFSLLVKIARFGCKEGITNEYVKETLLKPFRKNFKLFITSPFSLKRKIVSFVIYFNWSLAKKIFKKR